LGLNPDPKLLLLVTAKGRQWQRLVAEIRRQLRRRGVTARMIIMKPVASDVVVAIESRLGEIAQQS
jgi:hypothetical protein